MTLTHFAASAHCSEQCGRAVVSVFRSIWRILPSNQARAFFAGSVAVGGPGAWWAGPRALRWIERRGDRNRQAGYGTARASDRRPPNNTNRENRP